MKLPPLALFLRRCPETDLVSSGKLEVVERRELDKVLSEQELELSGAIDESKAPRVGSWLLCS